MDSPESLRSESERSSLFDETYNRTSRGLPYERSDHWLNFFGLIAHEIIRSLKPRIVLDAGCAKGFLVEAFWDRGVEAHGIDISELAISQVRRDVRRYCFEGSIAQPLKGRYDLITCIEVLEHLAPEEAEGAITNLTALADTILFSSPPSDFNEPSHFNVQPPIRWLNQFAAVGFWPDCTFDASFVAPHAMLLRRQPPPPRDVLILFSEKIRLTCALVERARQSQAEMEHVKAEVKRSKAEVSGLNTAAAHSQAEMGQLKAELERSQVASQLLESKIRTETERVIALLRENATVKSESTALVKQRDQLQRDLQVMAESPGWKLIQRYRAWLWHQAKIRPGLFGTYQKIATRLLRTVAAETSANPTPFSKASDANYQRWIDENEPGPTELRQQRELSTALNFQPLFSVVLPIFRVSKQILTECLQSVVHQSYPRWELCIAYGCPGDEVNWDIVTDFAARDSRIRVTRLEKNLGISGNTNAAADMANGEYLVFLDHDDALAPFALFEAAELLSLKPQTDLIYSDHDYIQEGDSLRFRPLFKPDWSPDIMFSANYITHLTIIRAALVREVGGFDPATDGAQDWDLFLRVIERTRYIKRIPKILYHWRVHAASTAHNSSAKSYAMDAQLVALARHMERIDLPASPERHANGLLRVRWQAGGDRMVSIVIPTRDKVDLLCKCVSTILEKTDYPSYEILIVDTGSREQTTRDYYATLKSVDGVRVLDYSEPFNFSAVNNLGARQARGELLLFLNNDTEIIDPHWLGELAGWACYQPVGIVGARLLGPDGTIQHGGVVVGLSGFADHPFSGLPPLTFTMYGSTGWYRNYLAVTGACMMMRRDVFDELGGFDESYILCGSDVEICLRARNYGYRIVYNPFAELIHHERQTRGDEIPPQDFFTSYKDYRKYLESGDPYWSPNLSVWTKKIGFHFKEEETSLHFVQTYLKSLNPSPKEAAPIPTTVPAVPRPQSEAQHLVSWFDFSEAEVQMLKQRETEILGYRQVETIVWFIPAFVNPFYGGIFTILRFAEYWRRSKGVRNLFAVCGSVDPALMLSRIQQIVPVCGKSDLYILGGVKDVKDLPTGDAAICTLWSTAYFALKYRRVARRFYFIQDFEPAFYSAGSGSALVESTYRLGFYGIANTDSVRRFYEDEFGGKATHFTPCVDQKLFYPLDHKRTAPTDRPWQVFCYARPLHARNAFELLSAALRQLKFRLGGRVRILTAGENWQAADHNLDSVVENLGLLSYEDTARLYRESDLGVVLMLTRHPSYIPMELMASGCLVVTNRNRWTEWLLEHERTCLLSHTTATALADTIERGLTEEVLREAIIQRGLELVRAKYCDWKPEMEKVYEFMCNPDLQEGGLPSVTAECSSAVL
jgi:GT2 family glycosyltransferase/glycosyltransferase involved in cell wall biosynthesis